MGNIFARARPGPTPAPPSPSMLPAPIPTAPPPSPTPPIPPSPTPPIPPYPTPPIRLPPSPTLPPPTPTPAPSPTPPISLPPYPTLPPPSPTPPIPLPHYPTSTPPPPSRTPTPPPPSSTPTPLPPSSTPTPPPPSSTPTPPPPSSTPLPLLSATLLPPPSHLASASPTVPLCAPTSPCPAHAAVLQDLSTAPLPTPATSPSPPCPCAAPPHQGIDKVIALLGMVLPVALSLGPHLYLVYSGSLEKTTKLFGTPMVGGMVNSILWLLYSIIVIKNGQSLGLLILHCFISTSNFTYLMWVYAHKKDTAKGYFLGGTFILCLSIIFAVLQWTQNPSEAMIGFCGTLGLLSLFACHAMQLKNMGEFFNEQKLQGDTDQRSEHAITAVNLIPDCLVNLSTLIITVRRHPEHYIILASALLGLMFNVLEMILLSIIKVVGYFRQPSRINDVEDPRAHMPNVLRGPHSGDDSSVIASNQGAARTPNIVVGPAQEQHEGIEMVRHLPPSVTSMLNLPTGPTGMSNLSAEAPARNDSLVIAPYQGAGVVRTPNILVEPTQEMHEKDAACYVMIRQTTRGCEIFTFFHLNLRMRVIIEAIPRTMIQIERDLYIPMLVLAAGITAEVPDSTLIVKLEIHHWMLMWRRIFLRAQAQIETLRDTIAFLIDVQARGTTWLKRKRPMEQHEPYRKRRISKLQDN